MDELILTNNSFFSGLPRLELAKIIPAFEKIQYDPGQIIFEEGSLGDSLYIIANGLIQIQKNTDEGPREVALLQNPDCFGEMALFTGEKRSATAKSITHSVIFRLTKEKFDRLLKQHHFLALFFNGLLSKRLAMRNPDYQEIDGSCTDSVNIDTPAPEEKKLFQKLISQRKLGSLILAIIISGAVYFLLQQSAFKPMHTVFIEIILFTTLLCAFGIVSFTVASLAIPLLCIFTGVASAKTAFSGYAQSSWFFLLGFFAIAAALSKSGLLFRGILKILLKFPANYFGQTLALFFSGFLLTPILASKNARVILMSPIALDLCDALNLKSNSKETVGIAMSVFFGFGQLSFAFMNGSAFNMMMFGLLPADSTVQITWLFWLKASALLTLVFFILSYLTIILLFRPKKKLDLNRNVIKAQLITMGPLTLKEKTVTAIVTATLLMLVTQPLHQIESAWISIGAFLIMLATNVLSEKNSRSEIDWNYLIAFGALIGVGKMITDTGLSSAIAIYLGNLPYFIYSNPLLFLILLALIFYLIRFILPNNSALIIFMLTFSPIVSSVGINPFVIGLIALLCLNPWFFPSQNVVYQSLYQGTEGRLFQHKQTLKLAFVYVLITMIAIALSFPYWHWIGLIK